jgi:Cu-Zn family superoxide dismutase
MFETGFLPESTTSPLREAFAVLEPKSGSATRGAVILSEFDGHVTAEAYVTGLAPGPHAVHFHISPDCSSADGLSAGPHWNPEGTPGDSHAHLNGIGGHLGDLVAGADGTARLRLTTAHWQLDGNEARAVLGRSIVVHANADDLDTPTAAGAGTRIGCGLVTPVVSP